MRVNRLLRRFLCILLFFPITTSGLGAKEPEHPRSADLPFKLYNGYLIVVEGRIGNLSHLKFGVDTGITHTTIDRRVAKTLPISPTSDRVVNFDHTVKTAWSVLPELDFGPVHVSNASVMVGDLRYLESSATHVDAMIGLDVLRLQDFTIDYREKRISFGLEPSASHQVPMQPGTLCLTVEMSVAERPARLIVDSGLAGVLMYSDRLTDRGISFDVKSQTSGSSVGGPVPLKIAIVPPLRIGTRSIDRQVALTESPGERFLPGIQGYLGTSAIKARRVHFAFSENTLSWSD